MGVWLHSIMDHLDLIWCSALLSHHVCDRRGVYQVRANGKSLIRTHYSTLTATDLFTTDWCIWLMSHAHIYMEIHRCWLEVKMWLRDIWIYGDWLLWWYHDDVIKWKHFPRYWPFVRGIHRSPANFPNKWPVTRSFDVFFHLFRIKRLNKQSWGW